jgi:hypothetical protein
MSGFGKLGKLNLDGFKPAEEEPREVSVQEERLADRIAERHGLAAEPVGRVQLNRNKSIQDRMFVQGPLVTLNRFRVFCNEKGVPLHKGLEILLDLAER